MALLMNDPSLEKRILARRRAWGRGPTILRFESLEGRELLFAAAPVAKTYPAKPVTIQFESLDRNGAVVGRQSVTTEALTPDKSAKFSVTIQGANAVAFRYAVSP